jgi:hypothetical protein
MKLLREPLFHFLVLGALIFGIHSLVSKSSTSKPGEIVITRGKIENLIVGFTGTWQRPPSDEELQGLIRDYVREEVAYREALAMGLDRDDSIVRGRLRQKLEFVSDSVAARVEPTDADLQAYLQAHAQDFQSETTLSFVQVYLNPQQHGAQLGQDATRQLRKLRQAGENADLNAVGDPFVLESRFENLPLGEIKKMFGDQFATKLSTLKTGQWQGPVESGYGAHLVLVSRHVDGQLPPLSDVRQQVRREWANAQRRAATDKFYQALLRHYTVRVEPLPEKKLAEVR